MFSLLSKLFMITYKCFAIPVTGFLIANLAVADLGVGLLCIPFTVVYYELNFRWPFGPIMCKILPALMPCFVMGSVGTMLAISVGKYRWFGCTVSLSISAECRGCLNYSGGNQSTNTHITWTLLPKLFRACIGRLTYDTVDGHIFLSIAQ